MIGAETSIDSVINWIKGAFSPEYWAPIQATLSFSNPLPFWGTIFKDFYEAILVLTFFASIIAPAVLLLRGRKNKSDMPSMVILLSAFSLAIASFLLILTLMPEWSIMRFSIFAAFSAFPSIFSLSMLLRKKITIQKKAVVNLNTKKVKVVLFLIITTLLFSSIALRFQDNVYYGKLEHESEFSALSYLTTYCHHPLSVTMTYRTYIYYFYYDYQSRDYSSFFNEYVPASDTGNLTAFMLSINKTINKSSYVIRGARDEFDLSEQSSYSIEPSRTFEKVDSELIAQQFSLVYSNGNYSIYVSPKMNR
jgi:hypothetical protein